MLTNEDKFTIIGYVYEKWGQAYDNLKRAKSNEFKEDYRKKTPKSDFEISYNNLINNCINSEKKAKELLERVKEEYKNSIPKI